MATSDFDLFADEDTRPLLRVWALSALPAVPLSYDAVAALRLPGLDAPLLPDWSVVPLVADGYGQYNAGATFTAPALTPAPVVAGLAVVDAGAGAVLALAPVSPPVALDLPGHRYGFPLRLSLFPSIGEG